MSKIYDQKQIEKNIGICIYVLRKERELTAFGLGQLLEKSECSVTAWERGERIPSFSSIIKLCNIFCCTLDQFLQAYKRLDKLKKLEEVEKQIKDGIEKRNKRIFLLHKNGATFRQLAANFNITPEKVADICQKEQEEFDKKEDTLWQFLCVQNKETISLRVYNGLRRKGIHTKESLMSVIEKLIDGEIQFPQFGKGSRDYLERVYKSEHLGGK